MIQVINLALKEEIGFKGRFFIFVFIEQQKSIDFIILTVLGFIQLFILFSNRIWKNTRVARDDMGRPGQRVICPPRRTVPRAPPE